jgi:hypothetical protein
LIEEFEKKWEARQKNKGKKEEKEEESDEDEKPSTSNKAKAGSKRGRGRKAHASKKAKLEDIELLSDRDDDEFDYKCLHCNTGISKFSSKKKWTLATNLPVGDGFTVNIFEALSLFYEHFRNLNPLAALEPILSVKQEDRRVCNDCATGLGKFCVGLKLCVLASNKQSVLAELAGDLEEEKSYFGDDKKPEDKKPSSSANSSVSVKPLRERKAANYKEREDEEDDDE